MGKGNPIELVRDVGVQAQRAYNRIKKEGFTAQEDFFVEGAVNSHVLITIPAPPERAHLRFDYIHYSYSDAQFAGGYLEVMDGTTTYHVSLTSAQGWFPFDTTRWAQGQAVNVMLGNGGAGIAGSLNILGVRYEYLEGDTVE